MSPAFRWFLLITLGIMGPILLIGVGLSVREAYRPDPRLAAARPFSARYDSLRARMRRIADLWPKTDVALRPAVPLNPAPDYSANSSGADVKNTDVVMYDQLLDPDLERPQPFGLELSAYLIDLLRWAGPHPPTGVYKEPSLPADFVQRLERGLQIRYLVVARISNYVPPVVVDARTYKGGEARIQGMLVDVERESLQCAFTLDVQTDTLTTSGREAADRNRTLEQSARSALCQYARSEFGRKLLEICGGRYRTDGASSILPPCFGQ